jgi:hypothetical protein
MILILTSYYLIRFLRVLAKQTVGGTAAYPIMYKSPSGYENLDYITHKRRVSPAKYINTHQ